MSSGLWYVCTGCAAIMQSSICSLLTCCLLFYFFLVKPRVDPAAFWCFRFIELLVSPLYYPADSVGVDRLDHYKQVIAIHTFALKHMSRHVIDHQDLHASFASIVTDLYTLTAGADRVLAAVHLHDRRKIISALHLIPPLPFPLLPEPD